MPADFTVIMRVRHHFGDDRGAFPGVFVGRDGDFPFDCPGIDTGQEAALMFQSLNVENTTNSLEVNNEIIAGGIPVSGNNSNWNGNILLIGPNILRPTGNVLHIGARDGRGSILGDVDDFVIDNVVLMYKTRSGPETLVAAQSTREP